MERHFSNIAIAGILGYDKQINELIKFIIENRHSVILEPNALSYLIETKSLNTPIDMVFDQIVDSGLIDEFCTLYIDRKSSLKVPDIVASNSLTVDFKGSKSSNSLSSISEAYNKIVVNITPIIKKPTPTTFQISDTLEFRNMYVKGLLSRNYTIFSDSAWLNPLISVYLIETYARVISDRVGSMYNLDPIDTNRIMNFTSLFMASKLSNDDDKYNPRLLNRCDFLGNSRVINDISSEATDILSKGPFNNQTESMSLEEMCYLIANIGQERLSKFTSFDLYRICQSLGFNTDVLMTQIALEYPPYWAFLMINALSGSRVHSLIHTLKKLRMYDIRGKEFLLQLKTCRSLYSEY